MKKLTSFLLVIFIYQYGFSQNYTHAYLENKTLNYDRLINEYKKLDAQSDQMKLFEYRETDGGFPIHLLVINKKKNFAKPDLKQNTHTVIMIMNGIHPGESEGIDASLLLAQEMAGGKTPIPDNVSICIVPVYNVDGMLNRKKYTRANQNGPEEKGFRGTACNYDLNRDFIKADAKNTFAFYQMYHYWNPDVFLDNHTSNGADYQYTMTLICTQQQKLGGETADLLHNKMKPFLYSNMLQKNWEMVPYVNIYGKSPDEAGYEEFIESPKFSTGYTALFGTLSFVAETHMLKPYPKRVTATYELMKTMIEYCNTNANIIRTARNADLEHYKNMKVYQSNYEVEKTQVSKLQFKGYEAEKIKSKLGNYERTYYNREKPYTKEINYCNFCKPALEVHLPKAYIVPQCWQKVIERLKANNIQFKRFEHDTLMDLNYYTITKCESSNRAYEGHHVNNKIEVEKRVAKIKILKGDYLIYANQTANRYIAEVLEPQTEDGFFSWNFFDPILDRKEGFSDYAFEDDAAKMLEENPVLKQQFEVWKLANPEKTSNNHEVLNFIFTHSPYFEVEYRRYPVYRME